MFVAAAKVRDRRVIGHQVAGHDALGDVLHARPLDPRADRFPRAYAYINNATIIDGS